MKATFKLVTYKKSMEEKDSFIVTVITSFILVMAGAYLVIELKINPFIIGILLIGYKYIIGPYIRKQFSDWVKEKDITGTVEFFDDYLEVKNNTNSTKIFYAELESIYINYNHIKGKSFSAKDIIHNGLAEIKLYTKGEELKKFKFLIENENQINDLKPIWKNLYLSGIFIREKLGNHEHKTVMFDGDLTDDKLKSLMTELQVSSFYKAPLLNKKHNKWK